MQQNPLFSVLVANYNNSQYLDECIDSIENQSYQNYEIIIVDDQSKDNSIEVIEKRIRDNTRIKLFRNSKNKGCGYTKNRAISEAKGQIAAFVDPDDALANNALEEMANAFLSHHITFAYSQMYMCDENLDVESIFLKSREVPFEDPYFFNCPIQMAHFFAFSTEAYNQTLGIDISLYNAVDQDLYLKIYETGKGFFLRKPLYFYRVHQKGISQDKTRDLSKINFGKVIWESMRRRALKEINGKNIPDSYSDYKEIFSMLEYQNSIPYRIKKKLKTWLQ